MDFGGISKAVVLAVFTFIYAYFIGGKLPYFVFYISLGLIAAGFLTAKLSTRITAHCYAEAANSQVGDKVRIVVEIKNESGWPVPWVQCWVKMPAAFLLPDDLSCYTFSLSPHEKKVIKDELDCKMRGSFKWGNILMKTGDIFGLFTCSLAAGEQREVMVLPEIYDMTVDPQEITGRRFGDVPSSLLPGRSGTSFIGVRKYDVGDGISRIHWKASARTQSLLVKEYQEQKLSEFTLFLDMNQNNHCGSGPDGSAEKAVTLAASLASGGVQAGNGMGLVIFGTDRDTIPVGYGKSHFSLILKKLVFVQPGKPPAGGENLNTEMSFLGKNGHPFVITGHLDQQLTETLSRLSVRGQGSIVFLLLLETWGETAIDIPAREKEMARLRGNGVYVVTIEKGTDLYLLCRGPEYEVG